jgi:hypothetical protein
MTTGRQAIDYFFELSLFLFVATGFVAVASTSKLDLPTVVLVSAAIGLRGLAFLGLTRFHLQAGTVRGLSIAYFVFYVLDYFAISGSFVSATGHLLFFLLVMKLFSAETNRDYLYLGLIAFMEMLLAAILTISAMFFGLFTVFLLFGIATFASYEIKRGFDVSAESGARTAEISGNRRAFQRGLGMTVVFVTVGVLVAGGVLFFTMPRFTAGYFSNLAQAQTLSGFSNNVSLGEIGTIKQSSQVVMHVKLNASPANPPVLRWRGRAMTRFDGKSWTNSMEASLLNSVPGTTPNNSYYTFPEEYDPDRPREMLSYTVTVEPMNNSPVFVAPGLVAASGRLPRVWKDQTDSLMIIDGYVGLRYDALSNVGAPPPAALEKSSTVYPPAIAHRFLQLPVLDPRIRQLALDVTRSVPTAYAKATAIELHLRTKYGYTLEMQATGPDPVADFLFRVRQGHCEYFASAMTLMLRSIGIPARPVNGFLGGEYNDVSSQYVVRGSDAHTWVEAYFPGHGWITFDPTPAAGTEPSKRGLGSMAMWLDALHLFWTDWVVSFDFGRQFQIFRQVDRGSRQLTTDSRQYFRTRYDNLRERIQSLHNGLSDDPVLIPLGILLVMSAALAFLFTPRIVYLLRQWRSKERVRSGRANARDVTLAYDRFLALMARRGMQRGPAMTPAEFALEVQDAGIAPLAQEFTVAFEQARYGGATERLPELYRLLARLERPDTVVK